MTRKFEYHSSRFLEALRLSSEWMAVGEVDFSGPEYEAVIAGADSLAISVQELSSAAEKTNEMLEMQALIYTFLRRLVHNAFALGTQKERQANES